jgi:hypothetical protein
MGNGIEIQIGTEEGSPIKAALRDRNFALAESLILDDHADLSFNDNWLIGHSSEMGYETIVEFLLLICPNRIDPSVRNNYALRQACRNGHAKVVGMLLKDARVDPWKKSAIFPKEDKYVEGLRILFEIPDDFPYEMICISNAIQNGHIEVVRILCDDPRVDQKAGLSLAIMYGKVDIINMIMWRLIGRLFLELQMMSVIWDDFPVELFKMIQVWIINLTLGV